MSTLDTVIMDAVVHAYLEKHGHKAAADAMRGVKGDSLNLAGRMSDYAATNGFENLVLYGLNEGKVITYCEQYEAYRTWALGSLDHLRQELLGKFILLLLLLLL